MQDKCISNEKMSFCIKQGRGEFRDKIALRSGWVPVEMPQKFACGETFRIAHAPHCPKISYKIIRHNDILDSFNNLLNEVCDDVEVEHCLQNLPDETIANRSTDIDDSARIDINPSGFFN